MNRFEGPGAKEARIRYLDGDFQVASPGSFVRCAVTGESIARQIREVSLELYRRASDYAASRGIIIADTKFEFGLDGQGRLYLMDEVLTPDSSRFWPAADYRVGISPPSYDKQFVRDYLETVKDWSKRSPPPPLPPDVVAATAARYREALKVLTGKDLG